MRKNRTNKEKEMKKKDRGYTDHMVRSETDVLMCQRLDNKVVSVESNIHSVNPTQMAKCYNRKEKRNIEVSCPHLMQQYNRNMGGVDKYDMLMSLYRNAMKFNKLYKRIMFHLFDLCIVNVWLLYRVSALPRHCWTPLMRGCCTGHREEPLSALPSSSWTSLMRCSSLRNRRHTAL